MIVNTVNYANVAYESKVLNPEDHKPLVSDLGIHAHHAGIQPHYIWTAMDGFCNPAEILWIRKFHEQEKDLILLGKNPIPASDVRMSAMAGALIRNYINAKVMTLNSFLDAVTAGNTPKQTCLFIPNFFIDKGALFASSNALPAWRLNLLFDGLMHRSMEGLKTIIYVTDMAAMQKDYGGALKRLLSETYELVNI